MRGGGLDKEGGEVQGGFGGWRFARTNYEPMPTADPIALLNPLPHDSLRLVCIGLYGIQPQHKSCSSHL